jgi:hypothetical protein
MSARCDHIARQRLTKAGDITCMHCDWIFVIGLDASCWIKPPKGSGK